MGYPKKITILGSSVGRFVKLFDIKIYDNINAPESPMNIFSSRLNSKSINNGSTNQRLPVNAEYMSETPRRRPLIPSIKLNAFIITVNQITVATLSIV